MNKARCAMIPAEIKDDDGVEARVKLQDQSHKGADRL